MKKRRSSYIPKRTKKLVRRRDNNQCVVCEAKSPLQFDHIILVGDGGDNSLDNIQLLCVSCHIKKHYGNNHIGKKWKFPKISKKVWLQVLNHIWKGDLYFLGPLKKIDPHFKELWDKRNEFETKLKREEEKKLIQIKDYLKHHRTSINRAIKQSNEGNFKHLPRIPKKDKKLWNKTMKYQLNKRNLQSNEELFFKFKKNQIKQIKAILWKLNR